MMWPAIAPLLSQIATPAVPAPNLLSATNLKLAAPVVMAHGLFGFRRIGVGPITLAWYFRGIPAILEAAGNRVVVTRVHPTAGVQRRATKLGERILEVFPDEPVHLIGHSMGGLDARALIADDAWRGRILSLTTIATPHLGSTIADFAKLRVGRIYEVLDRVGLDHHGFFDVTRQAAARFNRRTPLPDWLPVFSVAGTPEAEDVCWPLRRVHSALEELEGPNDGLVSARSANAIGRPLPPWPLDHLRQMNWLASKPDVTRTVADHYLRVVANLVDHGFGAPA